LASPVIDRPDLRDRTGVFRDRTHGGELLGELLAQHDETRGLVLGIPAGGVPVGLAVSRRLALPFELAVVSKITPSWNTEVGYGAVAFDGTTVLDDELMRALGVSEEEAASGIARTQAKVAARLARLTGGRAARALVGETVVLVDDGLASGVTMRTALAAARRRGAARLVVAVPTGHEAALAAIARSADAVYCVNVRRSRWFAVADAYLDWSDLSDETLEALLRERP
jgi:putative phosphoribosyl transferase